MWGFGFEGWGFRVWGLLSRSAFWSSGDRPARAGLYLHIESVAVCGKVTPAILHGFVSPEVWKLLRVLPVAFSASLFCSGHLFRPKTVPADSNVHPHPQLPPPRRMRKTARLSEARPSGLATGRCSSPRRTASPCCFRPKSWRA